MLAAYWPFVVLINEMTTRQLEIEPVTDLCIDRKSNSAATTPVHEAFYKCCLDES